MAINWDTSKLTVTQSNLAKAEAVADGVRLDFGVSVARESGDIADVHLLQRILLEREAASNLLGLLNSLVSQQESQSRGDR
jgi:hypothetical protein